MPNHRRRTMLLVAGALTSGIVDCTTGPYGVVFNDDGGEDAGDAGDASDASVFPDTFGVFDSGLPADAGDASDGDSD